MYELISEGYIFRRATPADETKEIFGMSSQYVAIAYKKQYDGAIRKWYSTADEPIKKSHLFSNSVFESLDYSRHPQCLEEFFSPNCIKSLWYYLDVACDVSHYISSIDDEMINFIFTSALYRAYHFDKDIKIGFARHIYDDIVERVSSNEQLGENMAGDTENSNPYNSVLFVPIEGVKTTWTFTDIAEYVNRVVGVNLSVENYNR